MGTLSPTHWFIFLPMLTPMPALLVVPTWRILQRASFSGAWALLMRVPVAGPFVPGSPRKSSDARTALAFTFLVPCYIPPMRRFVITITCGLVIGAAFFALIYVWALVGYAPATQLLLKMAMSPFNLVATLVDPVVPDDPERGGQMLDFLLMVAWLQIGLVCALALAGIRAALAHTSA